MKTVLFVATTIVDSYQIPIFDGICEYGKINQLQVFTLSVSPINTGPNAGIQQYIINNLKHMPRFDAIIVSNNIIDYIEPGFNYDQLKEINGCELLLIIGRESSNHLSITIDNRTGISELVTHFVQVHKYTHIGFVQGIVTNFDAQERLSSFKSAMVENGLDVKSQWVFPGEFTFEAGYNAIKTIIKEHITVPEALICCDDTTALGAMKACKDYNLDIKITGFDNITQAKFSQPALTTVEQPLFELGKKAMQMVSGALSGEPTKSAHIPTQMILRNSCGCKKKKPLKPSSDIYKISNFSPELRHEIIDEAFELLQQRQLSFSKTKQTLGLIIDQLLFGSRETQSVVSVNAVATLLKTCTSSLEPSYDTLINCLNFLCEKILTYLNSEIEKQRLYDLHNNLFVELQSWFDTNYLKLITVRSEQFSEMPGLTRELITSYTNEMLIEKIAESLENIEIQNYCICTTESGKSAMYNISALSNWCKIQYATMPVNSMQFPIKQLIPDDIQWPDDAANIIILPLTIDRYYFGQVLIARTDEAPDILERIRHNISISLMALASAAHSQYLKEKLEFALKRLEKYNQDLMQKTFKDELTGLYNRRGFVENANQYIQQIKSTDQTFVLFYGDLDGLKTINDTYGHEAGDNAICIAAQALKSALKPTDIIARLGGDEFVFISIDSSSDDSIYIHDKIKEQLNKLNVNLSYRVSISLGTASTHAGEIPDIEEMMIKADKKLYQHKQQSKGNEP